MEIKIYLYKRNSNAERGSLDFFISLPKRARIKVGVGENIPVVAWDKDGQKVTRKEPQFQEINKRLTKKKNILIEIIEEFEKYDVELTQKNIAEKFKERVDEEIYKIKVKKKPKPRVKVGEKPAEKEPQTFWEVLEHYRKYSPNSPETIRKWNQVEGHIKAFKPDFDFKDITEKFYNNYCLDYLVNVPICNNTIDKHVAEIKKICNYAKDKFSLKIPSDYQDFKRMYRNPTRLALQWSDVEKIQEFEPLTEEAQQAKDMFLIACYTGLRWQNVSDLKPHNFIEEGGKIYLNVITYKSGNPLRFRLPKFVKAIIEKYQREIPKAYNSDVNEELKKIGRACKINDTVYVRRIYRKKVVETPFKKWEVISMHVGRHTFATEFLRRNSAEGLTALKALSKLLNHSSTSITEIYWNMVSSESDRLLISTFD